jgi:hypothetical protein
MEKGKNIRTMDKWTLFNKTNKSKLFVFINSFAVILLLTNFFAEKIFPGLKDTDIFMKGIWEIGLWVALIIMFLRELYVLIRDLCTEEERLLHMVAWLRFYIMTAIYSGFAYWNITTYGNIDNFLTLIRSYFS